MTASPISTARRPGIDCVTRRNPVVTAPWQIAAPPHVPRKKACVCRSTPRVPITALVPTLRSLHLTAGIFAWRFVIHRDSADRDTRASISRRTTCGPPVLCLMIRAATKCACSRNRTRRSIRTDPTISAKSTAEGQGAWGIELALCRSFGRVQVWLLRADCVWPAPFASHAAGLRA